MVNDFLTFPAFAGKIWPVLDDKFVGGDHLSEVTNALQKVALGETKRLLILLPPRYGKTTLVSRLFTAYFAGLHTNAAIGQVCGQKIHANLFAKQVMDIMAYPEFKEVFPRSAPKATHTYGVGGAMAGIKLDLAVCDDLETEREYVIGLTHPEIYDITYDWFKGTVCQRVGPDGAIVVVASRLSQHDLVGKILEDEADKWTVVKVPALSETGTSTWPQYWSTPELQNIRDTLGLLRWQAMYQQEPVEPEL